MQEMHVNVKPNEARAYSFTCKRFVLFGDSLSEPRADVCLSFCRLLVCIERPVNPMNDNGVAPSTEAPSRRREEPLPACKRARSHAPRCPAAAAAAQQQPARCFRSPHVGGETFFDVRWGGGRSNYPVADVVGWMASRRTWKLRGGGGCQRKHGWRDGRKQNEGVISGV